MAQQYSYAQPNGHSAPPFVHGLSSQPPSSLFTNGMNPTALVPGSMVPGNLAGSFPRPGSSGGPRRAGGVTRTLEEAQAQYLRQTAEANAGHLPRQNPTSFPNSFASISAPTPSRTASDSQRPPAPPPTLTEPTDGGPPFKVPLHNFFTRQTPLAPGVPFPSIDPADQVRVKGWMERDKEYEASLMSARGDSRVRMRELGEEMWKRGDWLGEKGPTTHTKVKMEPERARDRERGKRGPNRKELKLSKQQMRAVAALPEVLIPIRLEYEHEAYKLRDTFTWNLRDTIVTPEIFASHLCEDLRLPLHPFYKEIVSQIKKHLEEAHLTEEYDAHLGDDLASVREENRAWFETKSKRRKLGDESKSDEMEVDAKEEKVLALGDFSGQEGQSDELRVLIKLDITLDSVQLVDKFEWDISDPRNSPEDFADTFAADLGLAGEFRTAIAHSIREQVDVFVKSLCLLGHVNGLPIPDDDLRREFLPSLFETFRSAVDEFTPLLNQLTPDEVERNDKEREREVRRKRRQTKGRGVTLPDRDPVKTHRTLVPKPSTVPIHSYQDARGDMVYPMPEMSRPYPIVAPVVPPKPAHLQVATASPLRLIPVKAAVVGPPPTPIDVGRAGGSRLKRGRGGENGLAASLEGMGEASTSRATSPGGRPLVKKPPVIKLSLEELGLHEHMINGVWHCANCGVPDSFSPGRRKGPSGAASLCSDCGKYYHRLRRNKPCVYTTDVATHMAARTETPKVPKPRKEAVARSSRRNEAPAPSTLSHVEPGPRASSDSDGDDSDSSAGSERGRRRGASPDLPFVNVGSPSSEMSSRLSSVSPPPARAPPSSRGANVGVSQDAQAVSQSQSQSQASSAPQAPLIEPLPWMVFAADDLRSKQTDDRFEIIPRPRPPDPNVQEWRIRCLDCPGKLYNLGPGETLENFSVHFKNRVHRSNVEMRLRGLTA